MEDYQSGTLYSGSYSRRGSYVTDKHYEHESSKTSLNAVVAHLTASVEHLSEANVTLTNELTSVKDENRSFAAHLTKVEELVSKVEGKADQKPLKTRLNNHLVLKVCISTLFQWLVLALTLVYSPFCSHSSANRVQWYKNRPHCGPQSCQAT